MVLSEWLSFLCSFLIPVLLFISLIEGLIRLLHKLFPMWMGFRRRWGWSFCFSGLWSASLCNFPGCGIFSRLLSGSRCNFPTECPNERRGATFITHIQPATLELIRKCLVRKHRTQQYTVCAKNGLEMHYEWQNRRNFPFIVHLLNGTMWGNMGAYCLL